MLTILDRFIKMWGRVFRHTTRQTRQVLAYLLTSAIISLANTFLIIYLAKWIS
jgi:hypothetical protein